MQLKSLFLDKKSIESWRKAAIFFLGLAAISFTQLYTMVYPIEIEGYSNKFEYEQSIGERVVNMGSHSCQLSHELYKQCELAKHQLAIAQPLTMGLGIVSLISFIL
ncbi:hypothetical protein EAY46_29305, partial [Vibrio anguillarum]|nr:hypothetical protein [Vibrio anguillarum]